MQDSASLADFGGGGSIVGEAHSGTSGVGGFSGTRKRMFLE